MSKTNSILQFRIDISGAKPPIWRRLLIPKTATFGDLHGAIQSLFEWHGGHLHEFNRQAGFERVSISNPMMGLEDSLNQDKVKLQRFFKEAGDTMDYIYDFGDCWEHKIKLEKILDREENTFYPRCIKGKNAVPPEDMGGYWGFMEMLEAARDPQHPEHEEYSGYLEDVGLDPEEYDPHFFDLEEANDDLQSYFEHSI